MKDEDGGTWLDALVVIALAIILTLPFVSDAQDPARRSADDAAPLPR